MDAAHAGGRLVLRARRNPDPGALGMIRISKTWTISAAHSLPSLPAGHKCHRKHGHNYRITLFLSGELDRHGFVRDYSDLHEFRAVLDSIDHTDIDDLGLATTSAENLAAWLVAQAHNLYANQVQGIVIAETDTTTAEVWLR